MAKTAAWQRKEGKNPTGGLNAKGVASYRAQNPGFSFDGFVVTAILSFEPGFCAR